MKLLLIESSKSFSQLFQKVIEGCDVTVTVADSLEQALNCTSCDSFDVIYSPTLFGKDSAKSFCSQLRTMTENKSTPYVVYAVNASPERAVEFQSSGITELVAKVDLIDNLVDHVKKYDIATRSLSVVHIEDDRVMQILMKKYLSDLDDIHLSQFILGKEGIAYINQNPPDLLLLDMNLPDSSGWEIAEELRQAKKTQNLPIVAITGETSLNDEQSNGKSLFTEIIQKPFDQSTIQQIIVRHRLEIAS